MYTDKFEKGDHFSVGEELLMNVSDYELKCKAIEKSVRLGYFSFDEALSNYEVSLVNYAAYILMKSDIKGSNEHQLFETLVYMLSQIMKSTKTFKSTSKQAIDQIVEISKSSLEKV